ncbi:MAG: bifunctional UDP-N-acetylglucosamine diphosphorylase/glucosamine-1-phosphate N-acetyltransferase GlmU [Acidobacteria bacterium]|nr:bifunctional UDP-N-acetylglucosamine diphosphorylase/glucosamine-1-phosphate N-acetyltransferase GlmU [Acidobacteriota bacterium]
MKSNLAKVLHPLCGRPLLLHVLNTLQAREFQKKFVVVGHQSARIRELISGDDIEFIEQNQQLGTGHAVRTASAQLKGLSGSLLLLYGDTPLIQSSTLERLMRARERNNAELALITASIENPSGYGRVIRTPEQAILRIVEEKDATPEERRIQEVNPGIYCFDLRSLLSGLSRLSSKNAAGEYYLTDLVEIFTRAGKKVITLPVETAREVMGINSRVELADAELFLRARINQKWMANGVTILDPATVLIDDTVEIKRDSVIYPGVLLEGATRIGSRCIIRSYCHIQDSILDSDVVVDHASVVRHSRVGKHSRIGPFAHLRQNSIIGEHARIGNFVETKAARVDTGSKASHLTYLGDAEVGKRVNIGAGTITCNYDGKRKNKTVIEDDVFIGSNTQLVAPVTIHKGSYVAAGSSVTEDVPPHSLAIARSRQVVKEGWVREKNKNANHKDQGATSERSSKK